MNTFDPTKESEKEWLRRYNEESDDYWAKRRAEAITRAGGIGRFKLKIAFRRVLTVVDYVGFSVAMLVGVFTALLGVLLLAKGVYLSVIDLIDFLFMEISKTWKGSSRPLLYVIIAGLAWSLLRYKTLKSRSQHDYDD